MSATWRWLLHRLAEWSLLTPDDPGSYRVIGNFSATFIYLLITVQKSPKLRERGRQRPPNRRNNSTTNGFQVYGRRP